MNADQEKALLVNVNEIVSAFEALHLLLADEANNWHQRFLTLFTKLDLIADGVSPPVYEPASDPKRPTPVQDPRVPELLHDLRTLENTVTDLRSLLATHQH